MSFIAAGEILGDTARVRTLTIAHHHELPDGAYAMVDAYCTDPDCDCRKTMIQVHLDHRHVSTINFGWPCWPFSPRCWTRITSNTCARSTPVFAPPWPHQPARGGWRSAWGVTALASATSPAPAAAAES